MTPTSDRKPILTPGTHELLVDDVRQVYHVAGRGPICVAHSGGPGCHYSYLRSPELEQHLTMVYVEPVGTGASAALPDPAGYGVDTYVRFLATLIRHLDAGPVSVLGHSYGGCVAQRLALDHGDLVAALALYDTTPYLGPELFEPAQASAAAYPALHPDRPEAAAASAAFLGDPVSSDDDAASAQLRGFMPMYFHDFWARQAEFQPVVDEMTYFVSPGHADDPTPIDTRPRLGEITAPTVVVVGAHDFITTPYWSGVIHDGIPGSRLEVLEGSGHFGHIEEPEAFVRAVLPTLAH